MNFLGSEAPGASAAGVALRAYGAATLRRLVALKRRVDLENLFQRNVNVPPDLEV